MYRLIVIILVCLSAASPAPQAKDSDVTYVKIQPVVEDTPADDSNARESRIEKLPLTFPSNVSLIDFEKPDSNLPAKSQQDQKQLDTLSESKAPSESSESKPVLSDLTENKSGLTETLDQSETNQSETISDPNAEETNTTEDLSESNTDRSSDTVPSETSQSDRRARNFDSTETTETAEDVTERYEDELTDHTATDAPRTRAPPKFIPKLPKSSYFPKPKTFQSYSANHLDIIGKRKFRSRCSCQKIWNCPKLQISVPRCPDEYFLCCF